MPIYHGHRATIPYSLQHCVTIGFAAEQRTDYLLSVALRCSAEVITAVFLPLPSQKHGRHYCDAYDTRHSIVTLVTRSNHTSYTWTTVTTASLLQFGRSTKKVNRTYYAHYPLGMPPLLADRRRTGRLLRSLPVSRMSVHTNARLSSSVSLLDVGRWMFQELIPLMEALFLDGQIATHTPLVLGCRAE